MTEPRTATEAMTQMVAMAASVVAERDAALAKLAQIEALAESQWPHVKSAALRRALEGTPDA